MDIESSFVFFSEWNSHKYFGVKKKQFGMSSSAWRRFCKLTKILNIDFKDRDIDIVFMQVSFNGQKFIEFQQFRSALAVIAKKKNIDVESFILYVNKCADKLHSQSSSTYAKTFVETHARFIASEKKKSNTIKTKYNPNFDNIPLVVKTNNNKESTYKRTLDDSKRFKSPYLKVIGNKALEVPIQKKESIPIIKQAPGPAFSLTDFLKERQQHAITKASNDTLNKSLGQAKAKIPTHLINPKSGIDITSLLPPQNQISLQSYVTSPTISNNEIDRISNEQLAAKWDETVDPLKNMSKASKGSTKASDWNWA